MKKILVTLFFGLLISTNAYSDHVPTAPKYLSADKKLHEKLQKLNAITDWTYECKKGDFIKHVAIDEGCIALQSLGKIDKLKKKLVVFLHGDRKSKNDYQIKKDYPFSKILKDEKENINFFYLARPGHKFKGRKRSTGKEKNYEQTGDWNAVYKKSWDAIRLSGAAIKKLKEYYQPDELIVMGHSGGAQETSILIGRMPGLIDKAILSGCPCLEGWPDKRNNPWESPANQIAHIDPKTKITIITGKSDRETHTDESKKYAIYAKKQGLNVELHVVKGGHEFKKLKGRTEIMKAAIKQ